MRLGIGPGFIAMWVALHAGADTGYFVINNGLAPPNPANVIDADHSFPDATVYVQNVGCDASTVFLCSPPWGDPTSVQVVAGGSAHQLWALQSSTVTMSGGAVDSLGASDTSTVTVGGGAIAQFLVAGGLSAVTMSGGSVGYDLVAYDSSTVTITGGEVAGQLLVGSYTAGATIGGAVADELAASCCPASLTIVGTGFAIGGVPTGPGPVTAMSGSLTGTLESGEPIDNVFNQGTPGLISLVPEPAAAPLFPLAALGLAALRRLQASPGSERALRRGSGARAST